MQDNKKKNGSWHCRDLRFQVIASRIVSVRTSNTEPARVEVQTESGTRELTVAVESTELRWLLIQLACSDKRIRLAITDEAQIEAVEVVN
jgi:hypothetical protein